jgi:hypothetical protein
MKLTEKSISQLEVLLQTATVAGIEKMIIAEDQIRGVDDKQAVVIISKENVPDFGKTIKIGMNRLNNLMSRINLVKSTGKYEVEAVISKNGVDISHLQLVSANTTVQYRCASVDAIKGVPKASSDKLCWLIAIPAKTVNLLTMAISAMSVDELIITAKKDGSVYFEASDENNDSFSTKFADSASWIPEEEDEPKSPVFLHHYSVKTLLPLFKAASANYTNDVNVMIGEKGILTIIVNSYDFFIVPKI